MTKVVIEIVAILVIDILIGRRMAYTSALHAFALPKRVRRLLFIVDIGPSAVSVAAIIWQVLLYLTLVFFALAPLFFEIDGIVYLFFRVTLFEWLAVAVPLFIYGGISEIILKKR